MAKSRRKAGGCTRGRLKPKKLGKGSSTMRKVRGSVKPVQRKDPAQRQDSDGSRSSSDS